MVQGISTQTSHPLHAAQSATVHDVALAAETADLGGEVVDETERVLWQAVALEQVEVGRTRAASLRTQVEVPHTDVVLVEDIVEIAAHASTAVRCQQIAVNIIVFGKLVAETIIGIETVSTQLAV